MAQPLGWIGGSAKTLIIYGPGCRFSLCSLGSIPSQLPRLGPEAGGAVSARSIAPHGPPATPGKPQRSHRRAFGRFVNKSAIFDRNPTKTIENMSLRPGMQATCVTAVCDMVMTEPCATSGQPRPSHCHTFGQSISKSADFDRNPTKTIENMFPAPDSEAMGVITMRYVGTLELPGYVPGFWGHHQRPIAYQRMLFTHHLELPWAIARNSKETSGYQRAVWYPPGHPSERGISGFCPRGKTLLTTFYIALEAS